MNNRLLDHFEERGIFTHLRYGFGSLRSVMSYLVIKRARIITTFCISGVTRAATLDIKL